MEQSRKEILNILIVTHEIPHPDYSDVLPIYYLIKNLSKKGHNIYLFSMHYREDSEQILDELSRYCKKIKVLPASKGKTEIPTLRTLLSHLVGLLHPKHILRHLKYNYPITTLDIYYSQEIDQELKKFISSIPRIDVIYSSREMTVYVLGFDGYKVVHPYDCITEWYRITIQKTKNVFWKFVYLVGFLFTKLYETNIYSKFNVILVVTYEDKLSLLRVNPSLNVKVIPNGVDIKYFSPSKNLEEDPYSLVFVSKMNSVPAVTNVLWFYFHVFKNLKKKIPKIKLYLVGRDPVEEIIRLGQDSSVIVTGEVPDIRPYISKSSIVIIPTIVGTGIKNKTLQGMAMKKPVVSTPIGVGGILGSDEIHFIVADSPGEFAKKIEYLFYNPKERRKISHQARKLITSKYSWGSVSEKFLEITSKTIYPSQCSKKRI